MALAPPYIEWPARYSPADSVRCAWVSRPGVGISNRVLPDACMDIIWDGERLFVAGPDTGPVPVAVTEETAFAGVRFWPGRAPAFLGPPASELVDQRVDLADLWGEGAVARLVERLAGTDEPEAAADLLDRAVAGRAGRAGGPDPVVDALVDLLGRQPEPMGAVHRASAALSVGERRLYRRCCTAVGYVPRPWSACFASKGRCASLARRARWPCWRPGPATPTRPT